MIGKFYEKKGLFLVLACIASLFLFINCEVGLGNSVDTTPPLITITSPEEGAIIKNTFTIKGTSTDETYIKSVSVTLSSNTDKKEYGPFEAVVDKTTGTWEAVVNEAKNGKFAIPDGKYVITATAKDSASRTTIAKSLYTIDNTPPVVIIKRPGLNDSFGRTIKITGDISDSNTLKALYFTPFRNNNGTLEQLCDTQVYPNISGVGLELIVGKYFSSPDDIGYDVNLDTVYKAIYNSATAGTQDVFCVIEVEDSAKEYDPPVTNLSAVTTKYEGEQGNLSSGYFLYDEIYSKIYGSNGYGLSNNDLVKIMDGSYENPQKAEEVKEILSEYKLNSSTPTADKVSKFSLNPENSPTYSVSGYEVTDDLYSGIFNEAKITKETQDQELFLAAVDSIDDTSDNPNVVGIVVGITPNEIQVD
ncbi:MAG: hypothetical protein IKZ04_07120, partial [Spirochaetaceae bacterium]|nr:hypothetical protein [Spirochaetaceae bacterium]